MVSILGHQLEKQALAQRAAQIRLVLTDNDGTLTDGCAYYSAQGEQLKRYSLRDGMGVELLRNSGIDTAIITKEASAITARRAEKLRIQHVFTGIEDKAACLPTVQLTTHTTLPQLAYIGDDVNDLEIIKALAPHGLTAAPADADPSLFPYIHYLADKPGGNGAFRDFANWLLALRA